MRHGKTKKCRICEQTLPEMHFHKNKKSRRTECRSCVRVLKMQRLYGVTPMDFAEMYEMQVGLDPITMTPLEKRDTCVDHCHKTGRVRGLLTRSTNAALGQLMDDPVVLYRAYQWLLHDSPFGKQSSNPSG